MAVTALAGAAIMATIILVAVVAQRPQRSAPAAGAVNGSAPGQQNADVQQSVRAEQDPAAAGDTKLTLDYDRSKMPKIRQAIQLRLLDKEQPQDVLVRGI